MLTTKQLIRRANRLWNCPTVPPEMNRANKKKWVKAVLRLGDRWLLAKKIERLEIPRA